MKVTDKLGCKGRKTHFEILAFNNLIFVFPSSPILQNSKKKIQKLLNLSGFQSILFQLFLVCLCLSNKAKYYPTREGLKRCNPSHCHQVVDIKPARGIFISSAQDRKT